MKEKRFLLFPNHLRLPYSIPKSFALLLSFHCLRHTFATTLTLSQGMPIETISKLLGHTNIRTTQIYATVTHDYLNLQLDRLSKRIDALCADWKGVVTDEKGALVAQ